MKFRLLSWSITLVSTLTGLLALLYPFFLPSVAGAGYGGLRSDEMPLMMTLLLGLCLLVLLVEAQGRAANARLVALLGVLVAINSALRFLETAIPGPGGFSPIFFLILLAGYVYGGRFGFLTGALTLLVSALITGGVGPWLPGQMFTAGWVGLSAPLIRPLGAWLRGRPAPKARIPEETISAYPPPPRLWGEQREAWLLACFGALWGFLFGALMNLWSWPFIAGPAGQAWAAGIGLAETLRRYAAYYLLTSLAWDAMAAAGNFLLLAAFGAPALRALRRFRQRFDYYYDPHPLAPSPGTGEGESTGNLDVVGSFAAHNIQISGFPPFSPLKGERRGWGMRGVKHPPPEGGVDKSGPGWREDTP